MASKGTKLGLGLILVVMLWGETMAQSGCTTALISLSPCLAFVTSNSPSTPSSSCCSQLSNVVKSQPQCLCSLLNGGGPNLGISINQTAALSLPGACNVQTPPVSQCNDTKEVEHLFSINYQDKKWSPLHLCMTWSDIFLDQDYLRHKNQMVTLAFMHDMESSVGYDPLYRCLLPQQNMTSKSEKKGDQYFRFAKIMEKGMAMIEEELYYTVCQPGLNCVHRCGGIAHK
ncbi:non-specific lipid transfer protein GPI-anchored 2 [Artemisia annua]|uniref:Non-specific lipid transfer protein GPI-anchored 2 n=1 Tax=Artemisia annua TaxID=35608 RepID=A0A2U1PJP0_ARTAN|nr:non-specific lipid transfer protein GPI-anchored 2 [Artemisia annua]